MITSNKFIKNDSILPYDDRLYIINQCQKAIDEGATSEYFINTIVGHSASIIYDTLKMVKTMLLDLYTKIITALNNYILNDAKLCLRYKDVLLARYDESKSPIFYDGYTYPQLMTLPNKYIKSKFEIETSLTEIKRLIKNDEKAELTEYVNKLIAEFAYSVIGEKIFIDELNVDVEATCRRLMEGHKTSMVLTKTNLSAIVDDIIEYKEVKNNTNNMKTEINNYYTGLYNMCKMNLDDANNDKHKSISSVKNPEQRDILNNYLKKESLLNGEVTRLFNAYITIYRIAFNTKLNIINEKINRNRTILTELMKRTSALSDDKYSIKIKM